MPVQPLLILDGDSLAHRAFHGLPKKTRDSAERAAGALLGFGSMLLTLWLSQRPRSVIACWDTLETPTYRHEALPSYQAGREFAPELVEQLDRLPELVESFGFLVAKGAGFEADDFLAAAAAAETAAGGVSLIVTSDRDAFQLVSESVTVLRPQRGVSVLERVGPSDVREAYGVEPAQVCDFIALRGDPSDGIRGARGIGPVKAAATLAQFGSLEGALAAGQFDAEAEALRLYREIATMRTDAPLPELVDVSLDWARAGAWVAGLGLDSLAERLPASAPDG